MVLVLAMVSGPVLLYPDTRGSEERALEAVATLKHVRNDAVFLFVIRGHDRDRLHRIRVEARTFGVDELEPRGLQRLSQLSFYELHTVQQRVGRRAFGVMGHAVQIVERVQQPRGQLGLRAPPQLCPFALTPTPVIVEFRREWQMTV